MNTKTSKIENAEQAESYMEAFVQGLRKRESASPGLASCFSYEAEPNRLVVSVKYPDYEPNKLFYTYPCPVDVLGLALEDAVNECLSDFEDIRSRK